MFKARMTLKTHLAMRTDTEASSRPTKGAPVCDRLRAFRQPKAGCKPTLRFMGRIVSLIIMLVAFTLVLAGAAETSGSVFCVRAYGAKGDG